MWALCLVATVAQWTLLELLFPSDLGALFQPRGDWQECDDKVCFLPSFLILNASTGETLSKLTPMGSVSSSAK